MTSLTAPKSVRRVGVLSDTHGRLSITAARHLEQVDMIFHAGDFDTRDVYETLRTIAPLKAVKGNMDRGSWVQGIHPTEMVDLGHHFIYMLHDLDTLDLDPTAAGVQVVISGHTHRPSLVQNNGVLYVNPGSASMPRGVATPSLVMLHLRGDTLDAQLVSL